MVVTNEASPPIDRASLVERCMGDADFAGLILAKFQARVGEMLAGVERAAAAGDPVAVGRAGHAVKGAAANLSAEGMRAAAVGVESAAHGDGAALAAAVAVLRAECDRCSAFIPTLAADLRRPAAAAA